MMEQQSNIYWIRVSSYQEMSQVAADLFKQQLIRKPSSVLGLATGASPIGCYQYLVDYYNSGLISFEQVQTFNLDEYVGITSESPASYWTYMQENLFKHINIQPENIHIPNGQANDLHEECESYEQSINEVGGIDLQLLGIGVNGHIGFNEPGTPFDSQTHVVELAESTRAANAKYFDRLEDMPTHAITMGIQSILNAKEIVLIAFGNNKLEAMKRLRSGQVSTEFPASSLLQHPNVKIIYGNE